MRRFLSAAFAASAAVSFSLAVASLPEPGGMWRTGPTLTEARSGAAAIALKDGRVLFSGGSNGGLALSSAETLGEGNASPAGDMNQPRSRHAAAMLPDGRVLVVGGELMGSLATASAEIYDPATTTWTAISGLSAPRAGLTLTSLRDGNILVAGGDSAGAPSALLEIYDVAGGGFYVAGVLATPRTGHAAALLDDGRVLIAGGSDGSSVLASSETFDPTTGVVGTGPTLTQPRTAFTATPLVDGRVLVVGGSDGVNALNSAELLDSASTAFTGSGASLLAPRSGHLALRLPNNNNVLIVSGDSPVTPLTAAELYTPVTGGFDATGAMAVARAFASGQALASNNDGQLLVGGGADGSGALASSEIYVFHTIRTDKDDYAPGETVTIVGRRWQPGETVTLVLNETPTMHEVITLTAVADENGNFVNTDFAPDVNDIGVKFVVDAIGQGSGLTAQTSFTDGNVMIRAAGATGIQFTVTKTNFNGSGQNPNYNCSPPQNGGSSTHVINETGLGLGVGNNGSSLFTAPQNAGGPAGYTFSGWSCDASTVFYDVPPRSICVGGNSPSNSGCTATYTPAKVNTTTTVSDSPDPSAVGEPVTVTVTVAKAGTSANTPSGSAAVTFTGGTGTCSNPVALTGSGGTATGTCQITFTSASTTPRTIAASYAGDTNFNASNGSATHTVNKAGTATTIISDDPDPSYVGASYLVKFSVAPIVPGAGAPTGIVSVTGDGAGCSAALAAGAGSGECSIISTSAGLKTLSATYAGDDNFTNSTTQVGTPHDVRLVPTTTTITSDSPDPSVVGGAVLVSVSVSADSGTALGDVTIGSGDATPGCTATLAGGTGSCSITYTSPGPRTITASYAGTTTFAPSSDADGESHTVNKAGTTTLITDDTPDPSAVNQSYTVKWTVTPNAPGSGTPTGNVTVSDGDASCVAPVATQQCTLASTTSGSKTLSANYAGDTNFLASTSAVGAPHQVNARVTSTALSVSPDSIFVYGTSTATVTVTDIDASTPKSAPMGVVAVSSSVAGDTVGSCTLTPVDAVSASCAVTVTGDSAGARSIGASYAGNATHASSLATVQTLTVNKRPTSTALSFNPMSVVVGEASEATVTVSDASGGNYVPSGTVVLTSDSGDSITAPCVLMMSGSGAASCQVSVTPNSAAVSAHMISAEFVETDLFLASDRAETLMVYRRATKTMVDLDPASVLVGQPSTATVTVRDVEADGAKYEPSGTVMLSGATGDAFDPATASCLLQDGTPDDGMSSCTVTVTPDRFGDDGTHEISASFAQTDVHLADVGDAVLAVTRRSTMTEVALNPASVVVNESSSVTVTVTDTSAHTKSDPTGVLTLTGETGDAFSAACDLGNDGSNDGVASCTVDVTPSQFGDGLHTIEATFAQTEVHETSKDDAVLTVARRHTTTTLSLSLPAVVVGQGSLATVTVTDDEANGGKADPTGTISFSGDAGDGFSPANCVLVGGNPADGVSSCSVTVKPTRVGDGGHGISATFGDSPVHATSSGSANLTVAPRSTSVALSFDPLAVVTGQASTLTLTVRDTQIEGDKSAPAGTVSVLSQELAGANEVLGSPCTLVGNGADVSSCTVTVKPKQVGDGIHGFHAMYAQTDDVHANSNGSGTLTVSKAGTATTLGAAPSPSVFGQGVTFTAQVCVSDPGSGVPTGTVSFSDGATLQHSATLTPGVGCPTASFLTSALAAGDHTLTASYEGDADFTGSSGVKTHTVNKANTNTAITLIKPSPLYVGASVTVQWTVSPVAPGAGTPQGTVTVTDIGTNGAGAGCSAAVSAGQCTLIANKPGARTLTATYSGNSNFIGSAASEQITATYNFQGFFQPVDNQPTLNTVKNGSTVPVKWRLLDANGAYITDIATVDPIKYIRWTQVACPGSAIPEDAIEELATATGGTALRWDGASQFIYNWKTPSPGNRCVRLDVNFADGTARSANFKLK